VATRTYDGNSSHKPNGADRGQQARAPREIPARGWLEILMRTKRDISRDNISLIAAGVAFYSLLAIPPALAASIALWGLFTDPQSIREQISQLTSMMPPEAAATFGDQLNAVANRPSSALGWTAIVGFLLSLWSARAAMSALIGALDIVYEEEEKRGFIRLALTSILLTLGAVAGGVLALLLIAGIPAILSFLPLGSIAELLVHVLRWGILLLLVMVGLSVLYRFAPSRRQARWRWVSWGAVIATVLWIAASAGFSLFVANFGKYNETYGTIAGVIVLLMWLWISAFAALVGAEINSEMELQTRKDTTVHGDKPMGRREAWVADHTADETH
jgi:membrane protein